MFKHILIPTDGSKLALKGVKAGVKLARALGARVTALYVVPPFVEPLYGEAAIYVPAMSARQYKQLGERDARKALAAFGDGRAITKKVVFSRPAWDGILAAARAGRCDAIVMASHGRGAFGGLLLGSETQRVLAHSKIPVLVVR